MAHSVRLEKRSRRDGPRGEFLRAECSCGWKGAKVKFRHTAERHKEKHLTEMGEPK